jgi:hypothetical protein
VKRVKILTAKKKKKKIDMPGSQELERRVGERA